MGVRLKRTPEFVISSEEQEWIHSNCPRLRFDGGSPPLRLSGLLDFDFTYDGPLALGIAMSFPDFDSQIRDSYDIEVFFDKPPRPYSKIPRIRETGGRIETTRRQRGIIHPGDMHIIDDGDICLCTPVDEPLYFTDGFTLDQYITKLVIPFLYGQAFFEKYGVWPLEGRGHGVIGILESYAEAAGRGQKLDPLQVKSMLDIADNKSIAPVHDNIVRSHLILEGSVLPNADEKCVCGSGKRFGNCHPQAYKGILLLWRDLRQSSLSR
jgi:hypothetical protein